MKKLIYTLLCCMAVVLALSCSKDKDKEFIDELVGKWDVTESYFNGEDVFNNNHTLTIEKLDGNTIKIIGFNDDSEEYLDVVTATVDSEDRTISVPFQKAARWGDYDIYHTYFDDDSDFCNNKGNTITITINTSGSKPTATFDYDYTAEGYKITYLILAYSGNTCQGPVGVALNTSWKKQ